MTWVFIVLAVLVLGFGPILWLRPTARDRRQAALRGRARSVGFGLDVKALPRLDAKPEERVSAAAQLRDASELLAVYRWTIARKLTPLSSCRFLRGPVDSEPSRAAVRIIPGWFFDPEQAFPPEGWRWLQPVLEGALAELPADVPALALEPRAISFYWREGADRDVADVDQMRAQIQALEAALLAANLPPEDPSAETTPVDAP